MQTTMSDPAKSPLVVGLKNVARRILEEEARDRVGKIAQTPLGHIVADVMRRNAAIKAAGREWNVEDIENFADDLRATVARARAMEED